MIDIGTELMRATRQFCHNTQRFDKKDLGLIVAYDKGTIDALVKDLENELDNMRQFFKTAKKMSPYSYDIRGMVYSYELWESWKIKLQEAADNGDLKLTGGIDG